MDKIRVGIIGCGIIGNMHLEDYRGMKNIAEVVAVCDIDERALNNTADKYGIERRYTNIAKMFAENELDSVDVCLHNNLHAPVAIAAMEAGMNVYSEKPMAGSYADALAMYETAQRLGRKLHVQIWSLYTKETLVAKYMLKENQLGDVYHMRSYGFRRRNRPYVDGYATKEFVNRTTASGGAMFDMGVYHIAQLVYLTGMPELERVCGMTYQKVDMDRERREISGFNVEEMGVGLACFKGGLTMDILEAWAIHAKPFPGSIICGSKAGLTLLPLEYHTYAGDIDVDAPVNIEDAVTRIHSLHPKEKFNCGSTYHWISALRGDTELLPTAKIALDTQLIQEGIYFSDRLGREVTADEIKAMSKSTAIDIPNLIM